MKNSSLRYIVLTGHTGYISFDVTNEINVRYMSQESKPDLVAIGSPAKVISMFAATTN